MKHMKNIAILGLILALLISGCVPKEKPAATETEQTTTELESDIVDIDKELAELDLSELDELDQELTELEKLT